MSANGTTSVPAKALEGVLFRRFAEMKAAPPAESVPVSLPRE